MNKKIIVSIVAIIVVIVIAWGIFAVGYHGGASQSSSTAQSQTPTGQPAAGSYTSAADGFSVNFAGTPQVTTSTFTSPSAGSIPLTRYLMQSGSGSNTQYYVIDVYHYPQNYQFPDDYLPDAMNIFAAGVSEKYPGAQLTGSEQTQLLGAPAISGIITATVNGQPSEDYAIITTKGQNTYGLATYGVSQSDYNAFVNSFTFTQ